MAKVQDPLAQVRAAARRYHAAQAKRDEAMCGLQDAIRAADAAGAVRQHVIDTAGVGRQTVYDAIAGKDL